jgi:hypothetical protein
MQDTNSWQRNYTTDPSLLQKVEWRVNEEFSLDDDDEHVVVKSSRDLEHCDALRSILHLVLASMVLSSTPVDTESTNYTYFG